MIPPHGSSLSLRLLLFSLFLKEDLLCPRLISNIIGIQDDLELLIFLPTLLSARIIDTRHHTWFT